MWHSFSKDINKSKIILVKLEDWRIKKAKEFVEKVVPKKLEEKGHKYDRDDEKTRWLTGRLGEMAVEKLLHKQFCDWTIGKSRKYDEPDLLPLGYKVGVKSVEYGKYPTIFKDSEYPEIFCVILAENMVAVCGIADVETLLKYQDDKLIINKNLRKKGTKTCFYGFEHLTPLTDLSVLEKYKI